LEVERPLDKIRSVEELDSFLRDLRQLGGRSDPKARRDLERRFEWALASTREIADDVDRLVETNAAAIAAMSARGDRIDRLLAQNRAAINALLRCHTLAAAPHKLHAAVKREREMSMAPGIPGGLKQLPVGSVIEQRQDGRTFLVVQE
jgi:hypothetical protein